ncbi:MAG TPA: hypothetical protein VD788_15030 [Candidatus Polarisedimenticolaceae bacterium]|nr:hypothetical protein [Candidatus Polarisedimenticolaceae bacterium]
MLQAVFVLGTQYRFGEGPLAVDTDSRWFASLPPDGEARAVLELRRWPGDTVLSLYALPAGEPGDAYVPPVPGAGLARLSEDDPAEDAWDGSLETAAGRRPVLWIERVLGPDQPRLGALLLPGDGGLGQEAVASLTDELFAVLRRVEVREAAWKAGRPVPPGVPLSLPLTHETPGESSEEEAPWQVVRARDFTIGLPPGFRARRMDGDVPPPRQLDGGRLWFRGRTRDSDGQIVAVGDGNRFGYVARVDTLAGWDDGKLAPLPLRGRPVERQAMESFDLAAERSGASACAAERWTEPGFAGEWLLFRLKFTDHGYEIGLPVLAGTRSTSLYWIPATWRDERSAPAPPPIDPAERFGIKFERLTRADRQKQPWVEGYLSTPGLRAEVSLGISPAASLRSVDGYPIRFLSEEGDEVGSLVRLAAEEVETERESLAALTESDKPGRHRAARVLRDEADNWLFLAPAGHGFLFEFTGGTSERSAELLELWELMIRSVRLQ